MTLKLGFPRKAASEKKTETKRDASFSYLQMNQDLGGLLKQGLIETDDKRNFNTTKERLEFWLNASNAHCSNGLRKTSSSFRY